MKNLLSAMKNQLFEFYDDLWNLIYEKWPLYEKKPIHKKNLKNKSIDEIKFLKEEAHDYLTNNIPEILTIFWLVLTINILRIKFIFIILLIIVGVNIWVAQEEKENNIKIYNEILSEKLKEKKDDEKKYQNDILKYLKRIEKWLNNKWK